jgi:DivIVA domain-containing protein
MTEESGQQAKSAGFTSVLRGYSPREVDRFVAGMRGQLATLERERARLIAELERVRNELSDARRELERHRSSGDRYETRVWVLEGLIAQAAQEVAHRLAAADRAVHVAMSDAMRDAAAGASLPGVEEPEAAIAEPEPVLAEPEPVLAEPAMPEHDDTRSEAPTEALPLVMDDDAGPDAVT